MHFEKSNYLQHNVANKKKVPPLGYLQRESYGKRRAYLNCSFDIEVVLPGHGANGGPSLLSANEDYINAYLAAAQKTKSSKAVQKAMSKKYPDYKLPIILQISSGARFQKK
jgi:hypothetical protein